MTGEFDDTMERGKTSTKKSTSDDLTLQKAVDMGEYDPSYLSTFPEWQKLTRNMQWQMIRQALRNRKRILLIHWAELNNVLDFSEKPQLKVASKNVTDQLDKLRKDEEKLQVEYSL